MTDHKPAAFAAAPWKVPYGWGTSVDTADNLKIKIGTAAELPTRQATARLIAAAPALLAMLERAYEALSIAGQDATASDCATIKDAALGHCSLSPADVLSIARGEQLQWGETGNPADRLSASIEQQGCTRSMLTEASDRLFAIRRNLVLSSEEATELYDIEQLIRAARAAG